MSTMSTQSTTARRCGHRCEIYSRVCGYFRPVAAWNLGKREEFKDRKTYKPALGRIAVLAFVCVLLSGCASGTIAKGLTAKNVSGDGTLIISHIGLDLDSKIPEIKTELISGDFATVKAGTNAIHYRETSSASMWNAKSVTRKRFVSITLKDTGDVPATLAAVLDLVKQANARAEADAAK